MSFEHVQESTFAATQAFVLNGIQYCEGDIVRTEDISSRLSRQLYEQRMIAPVVAAAAKEKAVKKVVRAVKKEKPTASVVSGYAAVHKGFGRWHVVKDGEEVSGPMTQGEAQAKVDALSASN